MHLRLAGWNFARRSGCSSLRQAGPDKVSLDVDEHGRIENPFKSRGAGLEAKLVVKACQQAQW